MKKSNHIEKLGLLGVAFIVLTLTACNRTGPVQHYYSTNLGCLVANDFYAVYFSAYIEPEGGYDQSSEEDMEAMLKSHCKHVPQTGTVYFTADLIDEDLRETPIGLRLVEQELANEETDSTSDYRDVRVVTEVSPDIYSQGTIETQAYIEKGGHYALYLLVGGDTPLFEDDILKIPFDVDMGIDAVPIWRYILKATDMMMTFLFPVFILLLIMLPILAKSRRLARMQEIAGAQSRDYN